MIGSLMPGRLIAAIEPACNTIACFLHELAWERYPRAT